MADEENTQFAEAAQGQDQPSGPQFALQRIYLKDSSFESPGSPSVFQGQWAPKINFDIKTRHNKVQDDLYEVILVLTVEAKIEEKVAFLVEVHQAVIFAATGFDAPQIEQMLATVCPTILFPYAREAIDSLALKGSYPALALAPINFDAIYQQQKQAMAEKPEDSNGESAQAE